MITEIVYDVLESDKYTSAQKMEFIHKYKLTYTDLFILREYYIGNGNVHPMINYLLSYSDSVLENKMKRQNKKMYYAKRSKRKKKSWKERLEDDKH